MCYIVQHLVFEKASEVVKTLNGVDLNPKQMERICHKYGQWVEEVDLELMETKASKKYRPTQSEALHYASVEGSMYLTREEDWKEIKLGRIVKSTDIVGTSKNRNILVESTYAGHLGDHKDFLPKMEYFLDGLKI
jgi:hypothetical protein